MTFEELLKMVPFHDAGVESINYDVQEEKLSLHLELVPDTEEEELNAVLIEFDVTRFEVSPKLVVTPWSEVLEVSIVEGDGGTSEKLLEIVYTGDKDHQSDERIIVMRVGASNVMLTKLSNAV